MQRCQEHLAAELETAAETERRSHLCQDCISIGVTSLLKCARKKVLKQANIDKLQASFSWAKSDLCVHFTEDSKEESKKESKVSSTRSCTHEKLTPSVSSKRSRVQAAGLNTHKKGKYTTDRQHQQLSSVLINSDKATYSPASSLTTANSMSAKIVSTSNSTLPNSSPGPPSNIGIAQYSRRPKPCYSTQISLEGTCS